MGKSEAWQDLNMFEFLDIEPSSTAVKLALLADGDP